MNRPPFVVALFQLLAEYRPRIGPTDVARWRGWLPNRGNVVFTVVALGVFAWAQSVGAVPGMAPQAPNTASTGTVAYQGRLANPAGQPLTGVYGMSFRLYANASGGSPMWTEQWTGSNSVQVSDGLFNVMLGSLTPIPESVVTGNSSLWLGITVGSDDEMAPRVQLGSVPFAVQSLTIADGSVTTEKIADGAVTAEKLAGGVLIQTVQGSSIPETTTSSTSYVDKITVTITTTGGSLLLLSSFNHVKSGNTGAMLARLTVDGTVVRSTGGQYNLAWVNGALSWLVTDVPAGVHTVKLQYGVDVSTEIAHISDASLTVVEMQS